MATIKIKGSDGVWKGLPVLGVQQFQEAPSDGKIYGRKDKNWIEVAAQSKVQAVVIPSLFLTLFTDNINNLSQVPSADILTALGGQSNWDALLKALQDMTPVFLESIIVDPSMPILYPLSSYTLQPGVDGTGVNLYMQFDVNVLIEDVHYVFGIVITNTQGAFSLDGKAEPVTQATPVLNLDPVINKDGTFVETVSQDFFNTVKDAYNNKVSSVVVSTMGFVAPMTIGVIDTDYMINFSTITSYMGAGSIITAYSLEFKADLTVGGYTSTSTLQINGQGDKALMNDGVYKQVAVFEPAVTNSLSNLPVDVYSIMVTLSAASALSFASTPEQGWECMIDIKNTSSSTLTIPIPNTGSWQSEETSMEIAAGKIGCISVRYVHSTYVVIVKGFK